MKTIRNSSRLLRKIVVSGLLEKRKTHLKNKAPSLPRMIFMGSCLQLGDKPDDDPSSLLILVKDFQGMMFPQSVAQSNA